MSEQRRRARPISMCLGVGVMISLILYWVIGAETSINQQSQAVINVVALGEFFLSMLLCCCCCCMIAGAEQQDAVPPHHNENTPVLDEHPAPEMTINSHGLQLQAQPPEQAESSKKESEQTEVVIINVQPLPKKSKNIQDDNKENVISIQPKASSPTAFSIIWHNDPSDTPSQHPAELTTAANKSEQHWPQTSFFSKKEQKKPEEKFDSNSLISYHAARMN